MPIVHVTAPDKYDRRQLGAIADGVHRALVSAIGIPEGDRFQVVAGVRSEDVFVVLTENQRSDWSVGNGDAQLLDLALE